MLKDLVPQKRVASQLCVSRSTLWRASHSNIAGFPAPIVVRSRVYWRQADLPALQAAIDSFKGRGAFEALRRHAKAKATRAQMAARTAKRKRAPALTQPDLFGGPDAAGPSGAEAQLSGRARD